MDNRGKQISKDFECGITCSEEIKSNCRESKNKLVLHINNLESKLVHIEKKYKAIIDNMKGVIFQTDKNGLWTFLTPTWTKLTGFSREESLGKYFLNYISSDDRDFQQKQFLAVIRGDKKYCRYEIRYCTRKGELRWAQIYMRPRMDKEENIIGTLGTLHDITDRKQAENVLNFLYELRRRSDFLNDIITGSIQVNEIVSRSMKKLGIDLSRPLFCCLLVSESFVDNEKEKNFIIEILSESKEYVVWECKNNIGIIYHYIEKQEENEERSLFFADFLLEKIKKNNPQLQVMVGISSVQRGFDSFRKAYWQAWSATVAAQCHGKKLEGTYHYKDLGILQLLVRSIGNESSDEFIREQLGKLISYDQDKGTNFLITLDEILKSSTLKRVAEKMFLHPKTVIFRKQRIEKILGVSIDLFETRLALAVALKLYSISQFIKKH
ncbi:PAS domain S-box protein [Pelosinus sp. sgz500959]|uniref:PAS domain S-box protein n=1 Tax=Pelosinus sp. sgz500959 TaxID=3242472 RepID=UPI00366C7ECD